MTRISKDSYFMLMMGLIKSRSTCTRRAVGAIITDTDGKVLATGYNGPPRGFPHCTDTPCMGARDEAGDTSRCEAVHAEQNALLQCHRLDLADTIYVSCTPCFECARMIANTTITRVVCGEPYSERRGFDILQRAGIHIQVAA